MVDTEHMSVLLTIGEFSRMTHLSVKAPRHDDDVGPAEPARVDSSSGEVCWPIRADAIPATRT